VTILADRGFGDHKLFKFLDDLGFGYVIRFRGNIHVTDATGETRAAAQWVGKFGRARKLRARPGHRVARLPGRCGGLCSRQGDEGALVSCRQQRWGIERQGGELLCQTLDNRAKFPRYQRLTLRHGAWRHAHRRTNPARPTAAHQRIRHGVAHLAWRRGRKPRHGPPAQIQHVEDPNAFVVSPRLYALRTHPDHAGYSDYPRLWPASLRLYPTAGRSADFSRWFEMRGSVSMERGLLLSANQNMPNMPPYRPVRMDQTIYLSNIANYLRKSQNSI